MRGIAVFAASILFLILLGLSLRSLPLLRTTDIGSVLFSSDWHPLRGEFGLLPFIVGTIWVTVVASVVAIPLCLLTAIYLSEYARSMARKWMKPLIDLLAGIPSVVYGIWGVLVIVPPIGDHLAPMMNRYSSGYSVLAGGIVLAVMIFPIIIHVSSEVLETVPQELRRASLSLGATRWQTIKKVVLRRAAPGLLAAIVLGISRALGETMAVLMVVGNMPRIPHSVLDPAYPLTALIANNYGEMMSVPLYDSALLFASLVLLLVVAFFNVISQIILVRVQRRMR